jgi:hypothetical protein
VPKSRTSAGLLPTWPATVAFCLVLLVAWSARQWVNDTWTERAQGIFEITTASVESEVFHRFELYGSALASGAAVAQTVQANDPAGAAQILDFFRLKTGLPELVGMGLLIPSDPERPLSSGSGIKGLVLARPDPAEAPISKESAASDTLIADLLDNEASRTALDEASALSLGAGAPIGSALIWAEVDQAQAPIALLATPVALPGQPNEPDTIAGWIVAAIDLRASVESLGSAFARDIALTALADD